LIFSIMALVMVASIVMTYQMGLFALNAEEGLDNERLVMDDLRGTLATLMDAETGERGYVLTSDPQFLLPYHEAVAQIHGQLASLDQFVRAGQLDLADMAQLRRMVEQKLTHMRRSIQLMGEGKKEEASKAVASSRDEMIGLRAHVQQMVTVESAELDNLRHSATHWTNLRTAVIALVAIINLAFLYLVFRRIRRAVAAREAATAEMRRQKDLLEVTLASIGDAVIVTDTDARITFMNHEAQHLTGWTQAQAAGLNIENVFHIINEETRDPVANPIQRVLREGIVVGLPNHTLLIQKEGQEIPIDDSGAPVRQTGGPVRGAVLIFRDFSAHRSAETRLLESRNELELANQSKDRFLATLSHELRTPLMPVLTTLSAWESLDLPPSIQSDIHLLRRNVELEARLIDDLLDLNRIIKGKLALSPEVVDVHTLIQNVITMYQSEIRGKKVTLAIHLEAQRSHTQADPVRLQQVFWNILKNAVKFTPEGGTIHISSRDEQQRLVLQFRDSGIGMSKETLKDVFLPFQQGPANISRNYGGLGLGMSIAKALLDAHNGDISAQSEGTGHGATFTLSLPTVDAPAHVDAVSLSGDGTNNLPLNILLVEDHIDTADVLSRLLRMKGHHVQTAGSMAIALDLAQRESFDVILSDIGLPDGTGIDLIRALRRHSQIPAIALTGFGMEDDISRCVEAGFTTHLTKPVNFQRLELTLRRTALHKVTKPL
jgi:PAS domain S-box-containing protein